MLTAKPQLNLHNAREYFREHLSAGDYYAEGHKVTGQWFGLGAEKLGLKGAVKESEFLSLCEGVNPATGQRLTARKNSHRRVDGRTVANRRVFYDWVFSPPKSVSIAAFLRDGRILELHDQAVRTAMKELETFTETRVRKTGQRGDRLTGNIMGAAFRHDTSRAADPHLHSHCVAFNATFDPVESRWKALEVQGMYRARKFAENLYYHELCRGLRRLGYEIENNAQDFEIKGVPRAVIARFSKRHRQIDAETEQRLKRDGHCGDLNSIRRQIAVRSRRRKARDSEAGRLRPHWESQLTAEEALALASLKPSPLHLRSAPDAAAAVAWADERVFERKAVAREQELWSEALARARGAELDLAAIRAEAARRGYIREPGTGRITSPEVLEAEMAVVLAARQGRNWFAPFNPAYKPAEKLSHEQRVAVKKMLGSQDLITLFRGGAGTGKSFALAELKRGLETAGHPVVVLAPQRQQVNDLQSGGLPADTLARCLQAQSLPAGAAVLVDEAGQIGARQLRRLVALVQTRQGRLILSGDTRQHGAVEASDALLAIERYSGAKPAVIRSIRRQDPARADSAAERRYIAAYRAAVKAAAAGQIAESFVRLDRLGCIREFDLDARTTFLAKEYLNLVTHGERALVVGQTWGDVHRLNAAIRGEMVAHGLLGPGVRLKTYQGIDLDPAQKRDARFYEEGCFAYVLQRYGRFARGDLCPIAEATDRGLVLVKDGRRSTMSYCYADRLLIAAEREIEIAPGDRLQLKFNGKSADGRAIANGELVTVHRVEDDGSLSVESDNGLAKKLSPRQRLFHLGYAVTSYASQGKTVDVVLVADSGCQPMADRHHWYVAISRARKRVQVFTPDKAALLANIERDGGRALALDMNLGGRGSAGSHSLPAWAENALAVMERTRLHEELLQRTAQPARRIAIPPLKATDQLETWRIKI